jgi:hypothetical protein
VAYPCGDSYSRRPALLRRAMRGAGRCASDRSGPAHAGAHPRGSAAVLGDPIYRTRAEAMRQDMQALPRIEHAVELLETLADERCPLLRRSVDGGAQGSG